MGEEEKKYENFIVENQAILKIIWWPIQDAHLYTCM